MKRGSLVVLEGMDGSGKSTQAVLLKLHFDRLHVPCKIIKAKPRKLEKAFKNFIKIAGLENDSIGYMFAFQALHRQQYEETTKAIDEGSVVIADRWNTSFFVYHNRFGPLSKKSQNVRDFIDRLTFENLHPDLSFFLNVPVNVSFERRTSRGDNDTFSKEDELFYESIRKEYLQIIKANNWNIIDGTKSIEEIHKTIFKCTSKLI